MSGLHYNQDIFAFLQGAIICSALGLNTLAIVLECQFQVSHQNSSNSIVVPNLTFTRETKNKKSS